MALPLVCCQPESEDSASLAVCTTPSDAAAPTPLRRLTRFEYGRSINALTGADPELAHRLPPDEESFGYDNNADAYSISTLHASKYLQLAEELGEQLVGDPERLAAIADCQPLEDVDCVSRFVRAFCQRAYRRAPTEDEVSKLLDLYAVTADPGAAEGLSAVVAAVLQAPQFLYRPETSGSSAAEASRVDAYALATRLSFLLVAGPPDEELLEAAASGSLESAEGLDAQAERLLQQPGALEMFTHFVNQWWELGALPDVEKDRTLVRGWTSTMPSALTKETRHFIEDAWHHTPTLRNLLLANHTFADAELAAFYGLPLPEEPGFHRVALDPARSAGLLTQGALLATHAKAEQTSPVLRGKFIRARLFCDPPLPPPPGLVVTPPTVNPRLSTRERYSQHASDPSCSGCHRFMDPLGFAFENYDAGGRWRDTDGGAPVDATGELVGTDVDGAFEGVPQLARRLAESSEVRRCVATQWFRFAFGRSEQTEHDACTIAALDTALTRGGSLRELVRATVRQPLFLQAPAPETSP